ncbi:hypothetical protein F511_41333 [Dorcoceras hygrometricum]|uniref:Dystroglycan-like n=1 Tax=Dorcoceras hygrometricum TaxID=472368 RepID=A0A2Z7CU87_9LAMI|nr:hypothetical protein F511_41333 [Dorcoceras hygrometricum]
MASTFNANSYQVNFDSVLSIPDHDGMLNMFKALEASGLRGFLGCESALYEKELEQFFDMALVQDGDITWAVSGKFFSFSQARSIFSKSVEKVDIHGKKRFMKHEYRLLNDILAKDITVKAGSFDVVTNERFMMMTAIHFGLKVNWSKVLFGMLKDMVDKTQKKAKGYAAQIGVILKSIPLITMGEAVPFPTSKILSVKIVNTYIAMNHTIDARGQSDEPGMAAEAVVKRKSQSKKKSSSADETPVEDVVPIHIVEPTPAAAFVQSPAPKRRYQKIKLIPSIGSDDENLDEQEPVKDTTVKTDEVEVIIGQVLEDTSMLAIDETEPGDQRINETEIGDDFEKWLDESFKDFASRDDEPAIKSTSGMDRGTGTEERVAYEQSLEMVDETGTTVEADGIEQEVEFIQRPNSPTLTDSPKRFDNDDIPLDDTADVQTTFPADTADISTLLDAKKISLSQQSVLAHNVTVIADFMDVKKAVRELNANVDAVSTRLDDVRQDIEATKEAISHQLLDFQAQAQENHNILTGQLSELVNYINRSGNDKKGEGSSRGPQPPPDDQNRGSGNTGGGGDTDRSFVERLITADRQRQRERSRGHSSGSYKRRRY